MDTYILPIDRHRITPQLIGGLCCDASDLRGQRMPVDLLPPTGHHSAIGVGGDIPRATITNEGHRSRYDPQVERANQ
eukprot:4267612-Pyramimonas_sp.AAC.1